ncbi:uncharacterized protein BDR25DRAFT_363062 [Lindgomyces ingoldianus]|uniref:Uncharacterized protein n=1 Tax=Lindgomyces ingoldianus TaxID=673940 RepID=A0ACB6Q826_9PLEO|nr:uncharacterized protein BDR25DRAFT_363062 [Lindgomyces ingoldianus]KAF2463154.1 hypothetical protein BDR25DRAFT_363062 [Lindgomyces ingoldianus]
MARVQKQKLILVGPTSGNGNELSKITFPLVFTHLSNVLTRRKLRRILWGIASICKDGALYHCAYTTKKVRIINQRTGLFQPYSIHPEGFHIIEMFEVDLLMDLSYVWEEWYRRDVVDHGIGQAGLTILVSLYAQESENATIGSSTIAWKCLSGLRRLATAGGSALERKPVFRITGL